MIPLPLHSIAKADVEALVADGVAEDMGLEYKEQLPDTESSRKRFLKAVTAFANTQGGDIVLGVAENRRSGHNTALPGRIVGLAGTTADEAKRLITDLVRMGSDPAVLRIDMQSIDGFERGPVLIVRVDRSPIGPHMVTLGHDDRFHARAPGSTYVMDSSELRRAFALSQSVPALLREFRERRLALLLGPDGPASIDGMPWLVTHVVPLSALEPGPLVDFSAQQTRSLMNKLVPMLASGWNHRYNADGFLSFTTHRKEDADVVHSYVQLMRAGALEAATTAMFRDSETGTPTMPLPGYEIAIVRSLRTYWDVLTGLELGEPAYVLLTLLGVRGVAVTDYMHFSSGHHIDRSEVQLPEVMIDDREPDLPSVMKPSFDGIAQSAGLPCSPSYDADGHWLHAGSA